MPENGMRISSSSGKWKALYAPERPDLPMDERFEEACENLSYIEYLADYLPLQMKKKALKL